MISLKFKDAHLSKKEILIKRGIIKGDNSKNILHQAEMPRGFSLNLCGHCNYKCSICPQSLKAHPVEFLKEEIFFKVFNELGNTAVYVQMSSRGENLLHPQFFEFVEVIKKKNELSYICLNTNAWVIDDNMMLKLLSVLDQIVFSVHTIKPDIYKKITNSNDFEKIVNRILSFTNAKKLLNSKTFLSVQFLASPENLPFKKEFIKFWKSNNLNVQIVKCHSWGDKIISKNLRKEYRYPCPYLWLYPTVTHSGKLTACFVDFWDELAYGSLEDESIKSLWQGQKASALREKHLEGKYFIKRD